MKRKIGLVVLGIVFFGMMKGNVFAAEWWKKFKIRPEFTWSVDQIEEWKETKITTFDAGGGNTGYNTTTITYYPQVEGYHSPIYIGYEVFDNLDVYFKWGIATLKSRIKADGTYHTNIPAFSYESRGTLDWDVTCELKDSLGGLYGGGFNFNWILPQDWLIKFGAEYLTQRNEIKSLEVKYKVYDETGALVCEGRDYSDTATGGVTLQQWKVTLACAKKLKWFTPYLGVDYLGFNGDMKVIDPSTSQAVFEKQEMKNRNPWRLVAGLDSNIWKFLINIEFKVIPKFGVTDAIESKFSGGGPWAVSLKGYYLF